MEDIDVQRFAELVWPVISEEAITILGLSWDGDFPGNSGALWIQEWRGIFFITSSDYEASGPYESLEEALEDELFSIPSPHPELNSLQMPLARLLELARNQIAEEGDIIYINSEEYSLSAGQLVRSDTSNEHSLE